MINLTSFAVCNRTPVVDVGRSTREFMKRVGLNDQGSEYRSLKLLSIPIEKVSIVPIKKVATQNG